MTHDDSKVTGLPVSVEWELFDGALLADGFEDALVGFGHRFTSAVAVYDRAKCVDVLITRDGMSGDEAEEYFSFNVEGADVGEHTPVFVGVSGAFSRCPQCMVLFRKVGRRRYCSGPCSQQVRSKVWSTRHKEDKRKKSLEAYKKRARDGDA